MKKFLVFLLFLIAVASLIGNFMLYKRYSSARPILTVGGDPITLKEYREDLEYHFGKQTLNRLALTRVVMQAAKKANVVPSDADVDQRIADIERRAPTQLEAARRDPAAMTELKNNLKTDMALENLRAQSVRMDAAAVRRFYDANKALFQLPTQAQTQIVFAPNEVDANTATALLKQKGMTPGFIASNSPRLRVVGVNFQPDWNTIPVDVRARLSAAIENAPVGSVRKINLGKIGFAVTRVDKRASAGLIPFEKARVQAERYARLSKAEPQATFVANLYKNANVDFEMDRYADYFKEISQAAN